MTRIAFAVLCVVVVAAAMPSPASAAWSRARLMSATASEQALVPPTGDRSIVGPPALSADGRFLVFDTEARNLVLAADPSATGPGGLVRRTVDGGTLELVAPAVSAGRALLRPAVSADGRHVAFTTRAQLTPEDTDAVDDVYVRDMAVSPSDAAAFSLVSDVPGADPATPHELAQSTQALSAVGDRVLFRAVPAPGSTGPLYVRARSEDRVVTVTEHTFGALFDAALSADGTTVAWIDARPGEQVPAGAYLPGEVALMSGFGGQRADLLWRRLDAATARRVAGAGDAEDPGCPPGTTLPQDLLAPFDAPIGPRGPCDGLFSGYRLDIADWTRGSSGTLDNITLSGDGRKVAWTATRLPRRGGAPVDLQSIGDLLVRDMAAPGGAKSTTRELTRFTARGAGTRGVLSVDGRTIVFTTDVETSLLPAPTLVSPTQPPVGTPPIEVYALDIEAGIIERVTRAYDGGPAARQQVGAPLASDGAVVSADGGRVAFRSDAENLIFGDGNGVADVFVADRFSEGQAPLPQQPAAPLVTGASVAPSWRLSATTTKGGSVVFVDVRVPAAGTVRGQARSRIALGRKRTRPVVAQRTVRARGAGVVRLRLKLRSSYQRTSRRAAGLPVRVDLRFTPATARSGVLTRALSTTFRAPKPKKRSAR